MKARRKWTGDWGEGARSRLPRIQGKRLVQTRRGVCTRICKKKIFSKNKQSCNNFHGQGKVYFLVVLRQKLQVVILRHISYTGQAMGSWWDVSGCLFSIIHSSERNGNNILRCEQNPFQCTCVLLRPKVVHLKTETHTFQMHFRLSSTPHAQRDRKRWWIWRPSNTVSKVETFEKQIY